MGRSCCGICRVELNNENWSPSDKKSFHYRCTECNRKRVHRYWNEHRSERCRKLREYRRKYIVITTGRRILKWIKREYTNKCELCNNDIFRLDYHHWDDLNLLKGMWLCRHCHKIAEAIESMKNPNSIANKYIEYKKIIEGGLKL